MQTPTTVEIPPTPDEMSRLRAYTRARMAIWTPRLGAVFGASALAWWPLDAWVFTGRPDVRAALSQMRPAVIAVGLALVLIAWRTSWLRRWPDGISLIGGLALVVITSAAMGRLGTRDATWFHYLYFLPSPTVLLLWPLPVRVVAILGVVVAAVGSFLSQAPDLLVDPMFWASVSFLVFVAALSALLGHLLFGQMKIAFVRGERLAASKAALAHLSSQQAEEIAKQTEDLRRLARRSVEARDAERRAVARDLHDSLGQQLVALRFGVAGVRRGVAEVEALDVLIDSTADTVRRLLSTLRPRLLDQLGCAEALRALARETAERAGLEADIDVAAEADTLSAPLQGALFHILLEALTNVERHASARTLRVHLALGDRVELVVQDDGVGLGDDSGPGLGRLGMRERALAVGGQVTWHSPPGTTLQATLPLLGELHS